MSRLTKIFSHITTQEKRIALYCAIGFASIATLPLFDQGFYLSISVNIVMYVVLCTAWSLFSGPTHYISLATAAFYGIGTYVVAIGIKDIPYPVLLVMAAVVSGGIAGIVGLATLRLSGVYFVVFTLGLSELIRQIVTWVQTNFSGSSGLYVFTDIREMHVFWLLLGLAVIVYIIGWLINRSRLGFAMQIIGNDETVAKHLGINTAISKILLFMISGAIIGVVGAIMAPRFSYVTPPSAFNPIISFQVVIMALLGGTKRLWGPLLGVIPFTILFDQVGVYFPDQTSIVIGVAFMAIVYLLPNGVLGLIETIKQKFTSSIKKEDTT